MALKISCVVPVYNEGARVKGVLDILIGHELFDEIIVVDDGSTDDSLRVLQGISGINLISYYPNRGKSHAVGTALLAAKNEWIMMVDSDLRGLKKEDIDALISPVASGDFDVCMAFWGNSLWFCRFLKLDFMSGLRVFRKNLIPDLSVLDKFPGFGFEVFLNDLILKRHDKIAVIDWKNVISPRKPEKRGFLKGTYEDLKMCIEMVKVVGFFGFFGQFIRMFFSRKIVKGMQDVKVERGQDFRGIFP